MQTKLTLPLLQPVRGFRIAVALVTGLTATIRAQDYQNAPAPQQAADSEGVELLSAGALDDLLGPIALYPDPLIALILPASTVPSDVTLAARYLANNGNPDQVDGQSWDQSVKSLTRYPDVLKWLDENLEWTTSVGNAFVAQPADVMNSIQRLRERATAAGNLKDTPQQKVVKQVVEEKTYIRIEPAEPEVIYVPQYDPEIVYVERGPDYVVDAGPVIGFGVGFAIGSWLNYDCDWGRRNVYYGDYNPRWRDRGWDNGWNGGGNNNNNTTIVNNTNITNITNNSARAWQPSPNSRRQLAQRRTSYNQFVRAANQEVRQARPQQGVAAAKGEQPRRLKAVPQPTRLTTGNNRPNQNPNRPGNAAGKNNPNGRNNPNPGPNQGVAAKSPGQAPNGHGKNGGGKHPSEAPRVQGELGRPGQAGKNPGAKPGNDRPGAGPNANGPAKPGKGNGNANGNGGNGNGNGNGKNNPSKKHPSSPAPQAQDRPKKAPSADSKPSSSNRPKNNPSADQPKRPKPSADRPQASNENRPRPQASQPRPKPQAESQPRPKPQQSQASSPDRPRHSQPQPRPQQSRPQSQASKPSPGNGGNGGGGNGGNQKKKNKKDNNNN